MRAPMEHRIDYIKFSLISLLLFKLSFAFAQDKEVYKHRFIDPFHSIQMLESQLDLTNSSEKNFAQWKLLIELYLKTEQLVNAEVSLNQLKDKFKNNLSVQPEIALLEAQLMLDKHLIDDVKKSIAPFQMELENPSPIERHVWYRYLLGSYQLRKNLYSEAMSNLTYARDLATKHHIHHLEMEVCSRLSQLFYVTYQYEEALNLSDEIIEHASKIGDQFSKLNAISNKMNIYYMQAIRSSQAENMNESEYRSYIDKSRRMQSQVFELSKSIGANRSMLRAQIVAQNQYLSNDDYNSAITTGEEVVGLASKYGFKYEAAVAANNIAIAAKFKGDFDLSFKYLKMTKDYYQSIGDLQSLSWVLEDYALTYELAKDYESSLDYFKKYHTTTMSIANKLSDQKLLELQQKFSANEKTRRIEQLTQRASLNAEQLKNERMQRWMLTVILSALLVIAIILYRKRKRLRELLLKEASLNQQIIEVNKAKQRFFNNLSHEFRTALTLSIAPLKTVCAQPHITNSQEALQTALENNLHMVSLLNEVMDIERMEAKTFPIHLTEVDIGLLVNRCVQRFKLQLREKGIQLKLFGFEGKTSLIIDQSHLEKIVSNIISNSAKYCFADCKIDITLTTEKDRVVLTLRDNGPGIEPAELPYIFNRFYQGQLSSEQKQPGTGVGLSMVKELVELHHAEIKLSNNAEQGCCVELAFRKGFAHYPQALLDALELTKAKQQAIENPNTAENPNTPENPNIAVYPNTACDVNNSIDEKTVLPTALQSNIESKTFNVSVPKADSSSTQDLEAVHTVLNASASGKETQVDRKIILIVDDNSKIRQLIRTILQQDYHIVEAENGRQALTIAESLLPDLLLVDVMMPEMDGYQLTRLIKSDENLAHLSIMLITALSETKQKVHGLELGANDYLSKPFDNDELKARIKNHLDHKQRISARLIKQFKNKPDSILVKPSFEGREAKRCKQLDKLISNNLNQWEFDVEQMYTALNMTRSSLYRYTQKMYGCSPKNLLKKRRLELAFQMLQEYSGTVSEVAYAVGYQSLSAFSRAFREEYQLPPTKIKSNRVNT